jgi:hypothetical protein
MDGFEVVLFMEGPVFGGDELVAALGAGSEHFVEFDQDSAGLSAGGVLDEEHHDEGDGAGRRVEDVEPAVREPGEDPDGRPDPDEDGDDRSRDGGSDCGAGSARELAA